MLIPELVDLKQLVSGEEIVTCPPVVEEVLRGARSERNYLRRRATFGTLQMLETPMSFEVFEEAAILFRTAKATGYTIRSPYDCLIAVCAIRNAASVLHADRDFKYIALVSRLQQRNLAH